MRRLAVSGSAILAVVAVGLYLYYQPHLTMYRIFVAANASDNLALQDAVDFPAVRENLKAQFTQNVMREVVATGTDNPFAVLGLVLAQKLSDAMIDGIITPEMLSQGVRNAVKIEGEESPEGGRAFLRIISRLPGRYVNASTYAIEFKPADVQTPIRFILQRDLISFRVTRIEVEFPKTPKREAKSEPARRSRGSDSPTRKQPGSTPSSSAGWIPFEDRSPIDDTLTIGVRLAADEEVHFSYSSARPWLYLRCSEGEQVEVIFSVDRMLDYDYESMTSKVRLRFGQAEAGVAKWRISRDREGLFAPNPEEVAARMLASKQLLVEFNPGGQRPRVASFTLTGMAEHLTRIKTACGAKEEAARAEAARRRQEAEKLRAVQLEAQRRAEERRERVATLESDRQLLEGQRKRADAEEVARRAEADLQPITPKLINDWKVRIHAKIKGRVVVPANIQGNPEAQFDVVLLPGGEVLSATLRKSSGVAAYDAAVERAIMAAQPLPVPSESDLFQENFRELQMVFRPRD